MHSDGIWRDSVFIGNKAPKGIGGAMRVDGTTGRYKNIKENKGGGSIHFNTVSFFDNMVCLIVRSVADSLRLHAQELFGSVCTTHRREMTKAQLSIARGAVTPSIPTKENVPALDFTAEVQAKLLGTDSALITFPANPR